MDERSGIRASDDMAVGRGINGKTRYAAFQDIQLVDF
jgi:hypothetical protein